MSTSTPNVHAVELQNFSENAAKELLKRNQLVEFFKTLNCELRPYSGGYKTVCPVCRKSAIYIGVNGAAHTVYWKCYSPPCPSNTGADGKKRIKNFLGLVRALTPDGALVPAMKTVAAFFNVKSTYHITNGALNRCEEEPPF